MKATQCHFAVMLLFLSALIHLAASSGAPEGDGSVSCSVAHAAGALCLPGDHGNAIDPNSVSMHRHFAQWKDNTRPLVSQDYTFECPSAPDYHPDCQSYFDAECCENGANLTNGDDNMEIGSENEVTPAYYGLDGDDYIRAPNRQSDHIYGGEGNDVIKGMLYDDVLTGGNGNDQLEGGHGDDILYGGEGDDKLYGDDADGSNGYRGRDTLYGGAGDDIIKGSGGYDIIRGGPGDDYLVGGTTGSAGSGERNNVEGGSGNDIIKGHANDTLIGGAGCDLINGVLEASDVNTPGCKTWVACLDVACSQNESCEMDGDSEVRGSGVCVAAGPTEMDVVALATSNGGDGIWGMYLLNTDAGNSLVTFEERPTAQQVTIIDENDYTPETLVLPVGVSYDDETEKGQIEYCPTTVSKGDPKCFDGSWRPASLCAWNGAVDTSACARRRMFIFGGTYEEHAQSLMSVKWDTKHFTVSEPSPLSLEEPEFEFDSNIEA